VVQRVSLEPALGAKSARVKRLRRLLSQRQARLEQQLFVVEGPILVVEALQSSKVEVIEVYGEEPLDGSVAGAAEARPVHLVAPGVLHQVLDTVTPQPVCAVVRTPKCSIEAIPETGPVLVLDQLRDPGNVGTLLRTAEAAGIKGVLLLGSAVDSTNPKVVRAAAGARLRLPVAADVDYEEALQALRQSGRKVIATVVDGGQPYTEVDLANAAIVLGNESHGVSSLVAEAADHLVTIPLAGPTESLNVSAAGAVLCFESLRQRSRQ